MPPQLLRRRELCIAMAVGRLSALAPARTKFELRIDIDIAATLAASVRRAPTWLVNLVVFIVAPSIWHRYLSALEGMSAPANAHAVRLEADTTGLYQRVQQWTGQPSRHSGKERWWHRPGRLWANVARGRDGVRRRERPPPQ